MRQYLVYFDGELIGHVSADDPKRAKEMADRLYDGYPGLVVEPVAAPDEPAALWAATEPDPVPPVGVRQKGKRGR